jgi:hypothetical protein
MSAFSYRNGHIFENLSFLNGHIFEKLSYPNSNIFQNLSYSDGVVVISTWMQCVRVGRRK